MNIIQTFRSREMPDKLRVLSEKVQTLHPGWNYMFFTDEDIARFFREDVPHLLDVFERCTITGGCTSISTWTC
jgi:mannosyltransferase OCH1-like enzyme